MTIREHISQVNAHSGFKNAETDEVLLHRVLAGCKLARDAAERSSVVDQLSRAEDSLLLSIQRINECLHRSAFYGEGDSALREACYAISSVIDLYLATGKELIRAEIPLWDSECWMVHGWCIWRSTRYWPETSRMFSVTPSKNSPYGPGIEDSRPHRISAGCHGRSPTTSGAGHASHRTSPTHTHSKPRNKSMAREHMDSILDRGIDYAIQHLEKRGEFFPFGLGMDSAGDISIVNAYTEEERPLSDPLIEKIVQVLAGAARKGEYTTTGVVSDVRLRDAASGESKDAIRIAIEDAESRPLPAISHTRSRETRSSRDRSSLKPGSRLSSIKQPR
ncbi:MAG: hypothetical protein ACFHWZ_08940 [Phycisphaerales bacterium]